MYKSVFLLLIVVPVKCDETETTILLNDETTIEVKTCDSSATVHVYSTTQTDHFHVLSFPRHPDINQLEYRLESCMYGKCRLKMNESIENKPCSEFIQTWLTFADENIVNLGIGCEVGENRWISYGVQKQDAVQVILKSQDTTQWRYGEQSCQPQTTTTTTSTPTTSATTTTTTTTTTVSTTTSNTTIATTPNVKADMPTTSEKPMVTETDNLKTTNTSFSKGAFSKPVKIQFCIGTILFLHMYNSHFLH